MKISSLRFLKCPQPKADARCSGELKVSSSLVTTHADDLWFGQLACTHCGEKFPVLAGVAVLLEAPEEYLSAHVKGIAPLVSRAELADLRKKKFYRRFLVELEAELDQTEADEHIEEDLESVRVNALYFMNHYLRVSQVSGQTRPWWIPSATKAAQGEADIDPIIDQLIKKYWDQSPLVQIGKFLEKADEFSGKTLELGCGVGGLATSFRKSSGVYLGVDLSFASIALARQIQLGVGPVLQQKIPSDLLRGTVSESVVPAPMSNGSGEIEFVVGTLSHPPVDSSDWNLSISCNAMDMLERPGDLPEVQWDVLKPGGLAVQSGPYIWHAPVAEELRETTGEQNDSAAAVEKLYKLKGFTIENVDRHVPWLFLKHARQLEVYSVHWFSARKAE